MKFPLIFLSLFSAALFAEVLETIPVIENGNRKLINAKIMKVKPDGLQILHEAGMETVPWMYLPAELVTKYRTDSTMQKASAVAAVEGAEREKAAVAARAQAREKEAIRLHELTGQPLDDLIQAVMWRDWCLTHPEGGVLHTTDGEVTLTKVQRDQALESAMGWINYRPAPQTQSVPVQVTPSPTMPAPAARGGGSAAAMYAMVPSDGHWIKGRPDRSEGIIVLENGSIWKASPLDKIDMILWMALDEIALVEGRDAFYPVIMINKSSKEQVSVKLLAK